MSERRRALPAWMARAEEKTKEKELLKSRRKPKTARSAFYCMNERELVEAAVSYLTDGACENVAPLSDHKAEDKAPDTIVKKREKAAISKMTAKQVLEAVEESSDCGDDLEMAYVSETDLDITEVETLPYTKSPQHQEPEGQRSQPMEDHGGLDNSGQQDKEKEPAEEDDGLQLVREIFFT